jgi:hypothetical protein
VTEQLFDEIVAAFCGNQVNVNDLPTSDPIMPIARQCESFFTGGVDVFRSVLPSERLRALGRVIWDLVGHKQVLVAIGPDVPSLSFTVMKYKGVLQGIVFFPKNWPDLIKADSFMQLGAILYVGAQIVDYYNDRLIGDPTAPGRWEAYEAEYLRVLGQLIPNGWQPNEYQRDIMKKYPDGLDSPGVTLYDYKGYVPAEGSA